MFYYISSFWQFSGWCLAIVLSVWFYQGRAKIVQSSSEGFSRTLEVCTAVVLICAGLVLRFAYLDEFLGGKLTSDENLLSVIYVSTVVHGEPSAHGATHLACAVTLDQWYRLFGFSPYAARAYAATLGALGLLGLYLGLWGSLGHRLALWSTAFLSISLFGIYFSKVAFEVSWVTMVFPVVFALLVWSVRLRSIALAACAGVVTSLGVFSYPGVILAAMSIALGLAPAYWLWGKSAPLASQPTWQFYGRLVAAMVLGALPFSFYAIALHNTALGIGGQPLMMGGGGFSLSWNSVIEGIRQVSWDSFVSADSWYLPFRQMSFFELALLPLAALGLRSFLHDRLAWPWFSLFLSVPILMLLVALTGAYPGMRRAIFAVIPYSIAVAGGVIVAIDAAGKYKAAFRVITLSLVGLSILHPLVYQFTLGREQVKWNFGDGFSSPHIPTDFLFEVLREQDIVLERKEFDSFFDGRIYRNYPRLYARYHSNSGIAREVRLIDPPLAEASAPQLSSLAGKRFMTWDSGAAARLIEQGRLCMPQAAVDASSNQKPFWGNIAGPDGCGSETTITLPPLGDSLSLRYDKVLRMVHRLKCPAAYCGPDRPDFLYAVGGNVSFLLQPRKGTVPNMLTLEIGDNKSPDRENAVLVNDVLVGTLSMDTLDATKRFARMPIPVAARQSQGPWTVQLLPPPSGRQGWDIRRVALGTTK